MLKKLIRISKKIIYSNPWWEYALDEYTLPDNSIGEYHYVASHGSTFIIPRHEDGTYTLVRQFRYLNHRESLEFPGGGIHGQLNPEDNAHKELLEETGLDCRKILFIGDNNPFNGVTDEICSVFLASDFIQKKSNPEISEEIELVRLSAAEIINKINNREIWDGMTLAAWSLYFFSSFYEEENQ